MTHRIINTSPTLTHLNGDVLLSSFCPEGFVGIGVSIGVDAFVYNFVAKTCRSIIDDVQKLDVIQDVFIHYQLLRFCQSTRLQYIHSHTASKTLLHMVLHLPHVDGDFGVTFNDITKDDDVYTATSRFVD